MTTDREQLELAAKAAGLLVRKRTEVVDADDNFIGIQVRANWNDRYRRWNPLADDGDALRLAVRCAQLYGWKTFVRRWLVAMMNQGGSLSDHTFATRRAIVRAAAEIGRMK